jgi:predicted enzyme related to lactoylglutathione lyase
MHPAQTDNVKQAADIDKDIERMKLFRGEISKVLNSVSDRLTSCQHTRQLSNKMVHSHAAMTKLLADFTVMIKEYDIRVSKYVELITVYDQVFGALKERMEHMQQLSDSLRVLSQDKDILGSVSVRKYVRELDKEAQSLYKHLPDSKMSDNKTSRHLDESLKALRELYAYLDGKTSVKNVSLESSQVRALRKPTSGDREYNRVYDREYNRGENRGDNRGENRGDNRGDNRRFDNRADNRGFNRGDNQGDNRGENRGENRGDNRRDNRGDNRRDNRGDNRGDNRRDNRRDNSRTFDGGSSIRRRSVKARHH